MEKTITIDIQKVAQQISLLDKIAERKNWLYSYDEDTDSLYYSPEKIDNQFSLFALNDEFSVYLDKDSNIGGIFIEYYKANLTSHDDKFAEFKDLFTQKIDHVKTVPKSKKNKALVLSEVIKAEVLSALTTRHMLNFVSGSLCIPA